MRPSGEGRSAEERRGRGEHTDSDHEAGPGVPCGDDQRVRAAAGDGGQRERSPGVVAPRQAAQQRAGAERREKPQPGPHQPRRRPHRVPQWPGRVDERDEPPGDDPRSHEGLSEPVPPPGAAPIRAATSVPTRPAPYAPMRAAAAMIETITSARQAPRMISALARGSRWSCSIAAPFASRYHEAGADGPIGMAPSVTVRWR